MKFTIGTVSSSLDFEEDLKLIKSSLLYVDEIELIGMAEYALFKYFPSRISSIKDIDSFADSFIPFFKSINLDESGELVRQLEDIKTQIAPYRSILNKKRNRSREELIIQKRLSISVEQQMEILKSKIDENTKTQSAIEIEKLIERGVASVFDYKCEDFNLDELAGGYLGNLIGTMQNNTAYPLFDKTSNDLISSCAGNRLFDLGNVNQEILNHAGIATNILMRLPTLEEATVDEILSFKKEMQAPLQNFRKAIYSFSESIESRPWDKDFQYDCLKLYHKEVLPRINELNELSSDTSVLKNMGRRVLADETIRKKAKFLTGGLITAVTSSSNIIGAFEALRNIVMGASLLVIAPNMISALLKTLSIRSEAKREVDEVKKEMKANTMYYYFVASKELKNR